MTRQKRVLDALQAGYTTTKDLGRVTGIPQRQVRLILADLKINGQVLMTINLADTRRRRYRPTTA